MNQNKQKLRELFEAESGLDGLPEPEDWRQYGLWLEAKRAEEIDHTIVSENGRLWLIVVYKINIIKIPKLNASDLAPKITVLPL
ncbi:hypothetical protein GF406_19070 [candidate division KSB1 bacterium]|nr:hypothetical protein [candidate division KSB1 bacterium]